MDMESAKNLHEPIPEVDFLSERVKVRFEIDAEAAEHLPEVTAEDLVSKKEKFRILLGDAVVLSASEVNLRIRGVLQMEEDEKGYYEEGTESVNNIKLLAIQQAVERLQSVQQELRDFHLLGEVHTHPNTPKEFLGTVATIPSKEDVDSIAECYRRGVLKSNKPFIFAIAAPDETGETQYAFYRLVKRGEEYLPVHLDTGA
ncbi:MAG: hypothetical protein EXS51_03920 [Candidatus Taylorbacteria bacterium]|nr:hypothetical protein [Candidatus Taylorbacteria bacterium]